MAHSQLVNRLDAALRQLSGGLGTATAAFEAVQSVAAAHDASDSCEAAAHGQEEESALRGVIGRAASRLAPLLRALRRQPPPSQGGAPDVAVPLYMQAACHVMELCLHLAPECGVSSEAQLQLAQAAISCLVTSGRTALTLAPAGSGLGFGSAASGSQLHHVALVQLQFAAGHISTPGFPAAAAAAAAPPAQFAAWLSTVVGQLKRLGQERSTAAHQRSLLPAFVYLCHLVCRDPAWAAHAAALAQPALAADAVQLCLSLLSILAVVLPLPEERRPDICTWATVAQLASVLREEGVLHAPLASHLHAADSGSASAAVAAAAQLMHLLPVSVPPPGFAVAAHEGLALAAIDILSVLCAPFYDEPAALSRWSIQQRQRVVAQLLPAVSQLPALLQLVAGRRQVAELDAVEQGLLLDVVRAACKQLVLLRDLSDKGTAGDGQQRGPLPASVEDAAAWCSAACSTLRCVPLVQQLYSAHSSRGEPAVFCELVVQTAWFAATAAAQVLASLLHDGLEAAVLRAANAGLFGALWQLHTQLARLVHFAAIADGPLDWLSGTQQYLTLAEALARCVVASRTLTCICEQADPADVALTTLTRQLQALSATHAAAVLAWEAQHPLAQFSGNDAMNPLHGLADAIAHAPQPVALDPAACQLFDRLCNKGVSAAVKLSIMQTAVGLPRLAAFLASGVHLDDVTRQCGQLQDSGQMAAVRKAMLHILGCLRAAATEAMQGAPPAASQGAAAGTATLEEIAILQELQHALEASDTFVAHDCAPAQLSGPNGMLPPARRLAAALLDWWRRPSAQQEQQLEAAQAAAARSCAYLRCANLGGGGGPAAGQGEGSQRCSACRAVWYCGTACSHADWRAGHKRVCKALGAARAAEKAALRQPAEEQG